MLSVPCVRRWPFLMSCAPAGSVACVSSHPPRRRPNVTRTTHRQRPTTQSELYSGQQSRVLSPPSLVLRSAWLLRIAACSQAQGTANPAGWRSWRPEESSDCARSVRSGRNAAPVGSGSAALSRRPRTAERWQRRCRWRRRRRRRPRTRVRRLGTVQMGQEGRQEANGTAGGADAGVLCRHAQSILAGARCASGLMQSVHLMAVPAPGVN